MKKTIAFLLIIVSLGFALPTLQGTRGTNFVSSARCENMGYLWFNIASEGYKEHVIFQDSGGTVYNEYDILAAKPIISLGFTPWHYLEFSVYGSAYYYRNTTPAAGAFGLSDVGGHVKGSIPFNPLDNPLVMALGLDGFFLMTLPFELSQADNEAMQNYLGYYPFDQAGPEFGGKLLFSMESRYISGHLNAGYWYRSLHTLGDSTLQYPQTIVAGLGLESSPWPWLNPFLDFNLNYGLTMLDPDTLTGISTHASVGVRFPILMGKNKGFGLLFTVSGGADPMNFGETMSLYAGIGIGGDLIQPKEKYLEGIVKDAETGEPIEGAQVMISGPDRDSLIYLSSDSAGQFSIREKDILESDTLYVTKEGYQPDTRRPDELEVLLGSKQAIDLELALEPIKESWIAGIVSDAETDEPLKAVIKFTEVETGNILTPVTSDPVTGYYRTKIDPGNYRMQTSAEGYQEDAQTVLINLEESKMLDIDLYPLEKPKPAELPALTLSGFGKGQRSLTFEQMAELERVADVLAENPDATVVIVGHTDSVGSDGSNIGVGEERAESVAKFLMMRGVDARRMRIESAGERFPIGDNRYRSGRTANRRVDMYFSYDGSGGGVKPPTAK